ncbi:hypothetical protein [Pseudomonas sp. LFM046]|uniref:hypothetical protein n=1 Tax=Pseudomonas sp. LFM046 TaxID=1608357 RepID=UPI0009E57FA9|nr:hypothetical protein [Pseudomonas sp. LFM046]
MNHNVERYLQAGTRANTRRSYQQAIEHFEVSLGGFLPATSDPIVRYLVDHAGTLASSTLKLRLAALAKWHVSQGFPDPTKTPLVRQVLKGIRTLHLEAEQAGWSGPGRKRGPRETCRACCAVGVIARCC